MAKKKKEKTLRPTAEYVVCGQNYCGNFTWNECSREELLRGLKNNGNHYNYIFRISDQVPVKIDISLGEEGKIVCQEMN